MKIITNSIAAAMIMTVTAAGGSLMMADTAEAKTYTKRVHMNNDKCYKVKKVPALVEYNTKGELLKGASTSWSGNKHKHGAHVRLKHHDPVYIQTSRVIEEQHTTLIPVGC